MNNNSSSGFSHGFLLGVLLGGGIVFLLGTKKGKKLLKTITEEGLEGIAELDDFVEDEALEYEEESPLTTKVDNKEQKRSEIINGEAKSEVSPVEKVVSSTRRLFRGIPKKN